MLWQNVLRNPRDLAAGEVSLHLPVQKPKENGWAVQFWPAGLLAAKFLIASETGSHNEIENSKNKELLVCVSLSVQIAGKNAKLFQWIISTLVGTNSMVRTKSKCLRRSY